MRRLYYLNSLSMVTKYTPPSCRANYVWYVKQNKRFNFQVQQWPGVVTD